MSVEGVRLVLIHERDHWPEAWIAFLTELCDGQAPRLVADDAVDVAALKAERPSRLITLAPMPRELYAELFERTPILAAVSALESFMQAFGGAVVTIPEDQRPDENYLMHDGTGLWTGLGQPLEVKGYPAIAPDKLTFPADLLVTAWNDERVALTLRHRHLPMVAWNIEPFDLEPKFGRELMLAFLEGHELTGFPTGPPEI